MAEAPPCYRKSNRPPQTINRRTLFMGAAGFVMLAAFADEIYDSGHAVLNPEFVRMKGEILADLPNVSIRDQIDSVQQWKNDIKNDIDLTQQYYENNPYNLTREQVVRFRNEDLTQLRTREAVYSSVIRDLKRTSLWGTLWTW